MQFVTDRLKFLNSLKFFGALAECPELLKAFSCSITIFTLSLSFRDGPFDIQGGWDFFEKK